jgi:hypothetical protein
MNWIIFFSAGVIVSFHDTRLQQAKLKGKHQ